MICNVVDRRRRQYHWRKVNAVVEATSHDNRTPDSDQMPQQPDDVSYKELLGVTLAEAVEWAQRFGGPVTLHIYDEGDGPERTEFVLGG